MTTDTFIKRIEGYYGVQYRPGQRPLIAQYLEQREGRPLDHLFSLIVKTFSSQYGKAPDIAVFEGLRDEVIKSLESEQECLALPPASEELTEDEKRQVRDGLAQINARFGLDIPTDAWGRV